MGRSDNQSKIGACEIVSIILLVIITFILICSICWCQYGSVSTFANVIASSSETTRGKILGGKHYKVLDHTEDITEIMRKLNESGEPAMIAILADFCGYCRKLKESGALVNVSKKYAVIVLDEKHPQTMGLMKKLDFDGFPCLAIYKNGNLSLYNGPRDHMSILSSM